METWLTSDTHFGHKNVIRYCNRPYETVEEMDDGLINSWNELVGADDLVFHLGDFGFGNIGKLADYRARLNGRIFLILGNHDLGISKTKWIEQVGMDDVLYSYEFGDIHAIHYPREDGELYKVKRPLRRPPTEHTGWCFTGHVHEKWRIKNRCLNVGVDVHDYKPIKLETARHIIADAEWVQNKRKEMGMEEWV